MQRLAGKAILVLEDEPLITFLVEEQLLAAGASVKAAGSTAQALQLLTAGPFDAAMLDVRIGDGDCSDVAEELRLRGIPFILTTGDTHAPDFGARLSLTKPFSEEQLIQALLSVLPPHYVQDVEQS